jgi:hypothetical protein
MICVRCARRYNWLRRICDFMNYIYGKPKQIANRNLKNRTNAPITRPLLPRNLRNPRSGAHRQHCIRKHFFAKAK